MQHTICSWTCLAADAHFEFSNLAFCMNLVWTSTIKAPYFRTTFKQGLTKFFAAYKQISLIGSVPTKFTINSTTNWGLCLQAALACLPTLSGTGPGNQTIQLSDNWDLSLSDLTLSLTVWSGWTIGPGNQTFQLSDNWGHSLFHLTLSLTVSSDQTIRTGNQTIQLSEIWGQFNLVFIPLSSALMIPVFSTSLSLSHIKKQIHQKSLWFKCIKLPVLNL